jgi:hypothetical protein
MGEHDQPIWQLDTISILDLVRVNWLRSTVLIAVLALNAACSSEDAVESADTVAPFATGFPLQADLPVVGRGWPQTLPFYVGEELNSILFESRQAAVVQCMAAAGFEYVPSPYQPNDLASDRVNPLDRRFAEEYGYHSLPIDFTDPNSNADPAFVSALESSGDTPGCAAQSFDETYGPFAEFFDQVDIQLNDFVGSIRGFDVSESGDRLATMWSECMKEGGLSYERPDDPRREFIEAPEVTPQELSVRMADLECDVRVGYTQGRHDWEAERVDEWLRVHEGVVAELSEQYATVEREVLSLRDQ